jgi:hypothetical protein
MGEVGVLFKASNFGVSKMTFSIDGKELEGDATIRRMTEEIPDWPSVADPDTYVKCYQPGVTTWYIEVNGEVVFTTFFLIYFSWVGSTTPPPPRRW